MWERDLYKNIKKEGSKFVIDNSYMESMFKDSLNSLDIDEANHIIRLIGLEGAISLLDNSSIKVEYLDRVIKIFGKEKTKDFLNKNNWFETVETDDFLEYNRSLKDEAKLFFELINDVNLKNKLYDELGEKVISKLKEQSYYSFDIDTYHKVKDLFPLRQDDLNEWLEGMFFRIIEYLKKYSSRLKNWGYSHNNYIANLENVNLIKDIYYTDKMKALLEEFKKNNYNDLKSDAIRKLKLLKKNKDYKKEIELMLQMLDDNDKQILNNKFVAVLI